MKRTIIRIDEAFCNGCGNCIDGCHEGALQLIDGKAVMISDLYCDGLGACIGECPVGAIAFEEREAAPYDEEAVMERLAPKDHPDFVQALADAVDEHTVLVSCMAVNNETGFANDVKRLYRLVKRKNPKTIVHIDAVQGFLKVPLDGDLISISGHKIHASKGIGALYIRKGIRISPLLAGGGQQKNLRAGGAHRRT